MEKICTSYGRSPTCDIRRLCSQLTILRAEKISMKMTLLQNGSTGDHSRSNTREKSYPLVTDQESGRIILSSTGSRVSGDNEWICRTVGAELGTLLHEYWTVCGREQLEWQCYAHLMTQCGRCPRPVAELEPVDRNTSRIGNFGYGGPRASVGRHQISRKRPVVEFPASLPPPLKTEKLTASPAIGANGG